MRLIDADVFKSQIAGMAISNNYPANKANAWCELIDAQPTAYDPDKVVEQLEEAEHNARTMIGFEKAYGSVDDRIKAEAEERALKHAIEIVEGGGVDAKFDTNRPKKRV